MVQIYTYLEIFLDDLNKQVNLSEFESYYNLPHQTIKRHLNYFIENNILTLNKKNKFLFYNLNLKNTLVYDYISICEKERLVVFLQNQLFKRLYEDLSEEFNNGKFLIFGSSVNNEKFNDIDLLVFVDKKENNISKLIKNFEKTYDIKAHLIVIDKKKITKSFKEEIIKKHIILNEHDFFVNLLYN